MTLQDDGAAPVLTGLPVDITVHGNSAGCAVPVKWPEPTATDGCGIASLSSNFDSSNSFTEGTTSVIYTAIDNCGNSTVGSFNVTVVCSAGCSNPPVVACPDNFVSCAGGTIPSPSVAGVATASSGSAACATPFMFFSDMITAFGSCNGAYTVERTWTAIDLSSLLTGSCVQVIELGDNNDPVISNLPGNITLNGTGATCLAAATWPTPTASDDCGISSFTSSHESGFTFGQGTTTVTYTATDNCNNVTTASFTVTVACAAPVCSAPPVLTCPANYAACPGAGVTDPSITGQASAVAGATGCGTPQISFIDQLISESSCTGGGTYNRVWTASDPVDANLTTSCVQTITLSDNANPVISNLPANISLTGSGAGCTAIATWSTPTVTDDCGVASLTSSVASGNSFVQGTTTVTYTAVDNCGNAVSASFTVTVNCASTECTTPPAITCPPNFVACADGSVPDLSVTGYGFGTINGPNCSGVPYTTFNDVILSQGPCAGAQVIERTWITTDPNNKLQNSCVQMISLVDNNAPVISNVPANIVVSGNGFGCQAPITWSTPTVSDDCGVASLSVNINSGITFSSGTTTIIYTAEDNCGNVATASFTVTVQCALCDTPPTIACPSASTVCVNGSIDPSSTGTAIGAISGTNCSGAPAISHFDNVISTGPCSGAQVIERLWMATDPTTNLGTSCIQTITVADTGLPVISALPGNIIISGVGAGCAVPVTWADPFAVDGCGIASLTSNYANGSTFSQGVTTVTYTAVDLCGNAVTASFSVTVNCELCTTPPSIACPANVSSCVGSSTTPSFTGVAIATPSANCPGALSVNFTDNTISSGPCAGAITLERTWVAVDQITNLNSSCVQTISLGDNTPPVIHNLPSNITVTGTGNGCTVPVNWTAPITSDNCGAATLTSNYFTGSNFPSGTTTVTYTAVDNCGNATSGHLQ